MATRTVTASLLAFATLLGATPPKLVGQDSPAVGRSWLSAGAGVAAASKPGGGLTFDLAYQRQAHLLVLRATGVLTFSGGEIHDSAGEIGLLYGRALSGQKATHAAAAIGLSLVVIDLAGPLAGPPLGTRRTIGIPIAAEVSANRSRVGFGLKGFANLNSVRSFTGLAVILKFGRLR